MAFRDTIDDYRRAARFRLQDARELLMPPSYEEQRSDADWRHRRGAMYLAGYAVECLLKAYLIQLSNAQTLSQATEIMDKKRISRGEKLVKNISRSAAGHQISYLILLADFDVSFHDFDKKLWGRVAKWQSSWRYESDFVSTEAAIEFMGDVEAAVQWISSKFGG
jgi:hypothetical protein